MNMEEMLVELVKARTEHLRQSLEYNEVLLAALKQIQSLESIEEVKQTAQTAIDKLPTALFSEAPLKVGGNPGEPVPEVDPEDLKTCWQMYDDVQKRHPGKNVAVGAMVVSHACKPGADIEAIGYRNSMLQMVSHIAPHKLAPWMKKGRPDDVVFSVAAKTPLEWMGVGIVREGFPFDIDEFFGRLHDEDRGRMTDA